MIFPPAFLDSSSCWNTNHNQLHQLQQIAASNCNNITTSPSSAPPTASASAPHEGRNSNNPPPPHQGGLMSSTLPGGEEGGGGGGGGGAGDGADGPAKPMSMSERARLARVPQPEPGLNCPRCDSTNTKFCYFNNYSLTQPRHFCRACRRYWTRGGALRNVPVGGGYRRHAKRAKPKSSSSAGAGAAGTTPTSSASATHTGISSCNTSAPASLQAMLSNGGQGQPPSHHARFADFDPASLGLNFPGAARLLFADASDGAYHAGGGGNGTMDQHQQQQQQQWAQMQSFPFLHGAMDHHHQMGPPAATTMAMQGMFHLGLHSGGEHGSGDDHHHHQFHHVTPPVKRSDHQQQQQQQDYTSSRAAGMYGGSGDVSGGGYTFYSSSSNAAGN